MEKSMVRIRKCMYAQIVRSKTSIVIWSEMASVSG